MENDNVTVENTNVESTGEIQFVDSVEELQQSMQGDTPAQPQEPVQEEVQQVTQEQPIQEEEERVTSISDNTEYQEQQVAQQDSGVEPQLDYSDDQIEGAVLEYLSERLGVDVDSFDQLGGQSSYEDERLESIARFVEDTGRSPEDWFRYQSLNPSDMDDLTAVRVDMASKYPNLSTQEVNLLIKNNYKFDAEKDGEEQVQLSQLQLKIDAENARKNISNIREQYAAPEIQQEQPQSFINDEWVGQMSNEVDQLTGLEFDLGNDKTFTFGLDDTYKSTLKDKNTKLDEFFLDFVDQNGNWDFDALSSHRAVVDNIDQIVSAAYRQGVGDGQKGLVEKAANVTTASPQQGTNSTQNQSPLAQQVKDIMRSNSTKMTFNI